MLATAFLQAGYPICHVVRPVFPTWIPLCDCVYKAEKLKPSPAASLESWLAFHGLAIDKSGKEMKEKANSIHSCSSLLPGPGPLRLQSCLGQEEIFKELLCSHTMGGGLVCAVGDGCFVKSECPSLPHILCVNRVE